MHATAAAQTARSPETRMETKVLISNTSPQGWPLDELLAHIRAELQRQLQALDGRKRKSEASFSAITR
jgi:hypothetical protein